MNEFIKNFAAAEYDVLVLCYEAAKVTNKTFPEMLKAFALKISQDADDQEFLKEFENDYAGGEG